MSASFLAEEAQSLEGHLPPGLPLAPVDEHREVRLLCACGLMMPISETRSLGQGIAPVAASLLAGMSQSLYGQLLWCCLCTCGRAPLSGFAVCLRMRGVLTARVPCVCCLTEEAQSLEGQLPPDPPPTL